MMDKDSQHSSFQLSAQDGSGKYHSDVGHLVSNQSATQGILESKTCCYPVARSLHWWKSIADFVQEMWIRAIKFFHAKDFLAEFMGTFILTIFGNGAIAQTVLSNKDFGSELSINVGYGVGLMFGAYIAIGVTGAHLNPAVTLGMALRKKVPWIKVPCYWAAQMLGGFVSSAVIYGVYLDALMNYECPEGTGSINGTVKTPLCTGKIWATYPTPGIQLSIGIGFLDQVIGTFLLMLGIWAICDTDNANPKAGLKPIALGFLIWGIGGAFGYNCGYAINPARDFAPRVFTAIAGWGKDVFVCSEPCNIRHWWWVPLVAPMVGAALATPFYWFVVEAHHPPLKNVKKGNCTSEDPGCE